MCGPKSFLKRLPLLALLCFSFVCGCFSQLFALETDAKVFEQIAHASVRIYARDGGLGSGSIFYKSETELLILTNAHVAGAKGQRVNVEFWYQGRLSKKVPGLVTTSVLNNRSDHDFAVVTIKAADVGNYFPLIEPIGLAQLDFVPDFSKIFSAGCPQGTWQTHWIGHGTGVLGANQAVKFVPMPANGRSGSAIYQLTDEGIVQVGLITYRTKNPGKDGSSETDGEGIAQTIAHIRKLTQLSMDTSRFSDVVDDESYELVPVQDCPGGVCPPVEQSILLVGQGAEKFSLKYVDRSAEAASKPSTDVVDVAGDGAGNVKAQESPKSNLDIFPSLPKKLENCPDGSCPAPDDGLALPLPGEPQRQEIFPNLPKPKRLVPEPQELKPERENPAPAPKILPERDIVPQVLPRLEEKAENILGRLGDIRKKQDDTSGLLSNIGGRMDQRLDLLQQRLELQRQELEESIANGADKLGDGILARLLDLPLIRQIRWLVRALFWPMVLFAIWWVPAFLLNLGPLWFLPVIRSIKSFVSAAWAGLKAIFEKKPQAPAGPVVDQSQIDFLVAQAIERAAQAKKTDA
jgi:hypothetical protein